MHIFQLGEEIQQLDLRSKVSQGSKLRPKRLGEAPKSEKMAMIFSLMGRLGDGEVWITLLQPCFFEGPDTHQMLGI